MTSGELVVTHTAAAGTLLEGTRRGDGSAAVLKASGWRWGRSLGCWYLPRSRDVPPRAGVIEGTRAALVDAGFLVAVEVDTQRRPTGQVEADRVGQAEQRAEVLAAVSDRRAATADALDAQAAQMASRIPLGQPVLVGHHSESRDRRYRERIAATMDRAGQAHRDHAEADRRAQQAAAVTGARYAPVTVANRVQRLAADIRDRERRVAGYSRTLAGGGVEAYPPAVGAHRDRLTEELDGLRDQLAHWERVRAERIATGRATGYDQSSVAIGDRVCVRGRWYVVARANRKTVSVQTGNGWTDTTPYAEIQQVRRPDETPDSSHPDTAPAQGLPA